MANHSACHTKKAATLLMAFLVLPLFFAHASASTQTEVRLYLTSEGLNLHPDSKPRAYFECSDKVYAVLEINHIPHGNHKLSLRWNDPAGKERERVDDPFTVQKQEIRLWAWLNLIRSKGAGMVQWINPAAGLEEFVGPWVVDAYVDNRKIASGSFSVDC